jgi:uracil-DNA glycosylase family 4
MDLRGGVLSALGWWREAGVDTLVDDTPRDWLKPVAPRAAATAPSPEPPVVVADAVPATLAAMHARLMTPGLVPDAIGGAVAPTGDVASGLMLLADMPDPGDDQAGVLMSGDTGRLFDRMLAAIGRDRASIYLAALAPARPAGGRIAPAACAELARLALQHAALAQPRALLLMGDAPARALLDMSLAEARGRQHNINHHGASFTVVATFHPRYLLREQSAKAKAWADLRLLMEGLGR